MSAVERPTRAAAWPPPKRSRLSSTASSHNADDDCASLTWLLNFRLDSLTGGCSRAESPPAAPTWATASLPAQTAAADQTAQAAKPPYTYTELIERALKEKGQLTVSSIYRWISEKYPFYKATDERWKNSVRHNLSINPHFRKGARASRGAGHLWSLAECGGELPPLPRRPTAASAASAAYAASPASPASQAEMDEAAAAVRSIEDHPLIEICDSSFTAFLNPVSSEQVVRECGLLAPD